MRRENAHAKGEDLSLVNCQLSFGHFLNSRLRTLHLITLSPHPFTVSPFPIRGTHVRYPLGGSPERFVRSPSGRFDSAFILPPSSFHALTRSSGRSFCDQINRHAQRLSAHGQHRQLSRRMPLHVIDDLGNGQGIDGRLDVHQRVDLLQMKPVPRNRRGPRPGGFLLHNQRAFRPGPAAGQLRFVDPLCEPLNFPEHDVQRFLRPSVVVPA